jgi:L-asparaginase II
MTNPVVIEIMRGERVESRHRGAGIVVDDQGHALFSFGDVEAAVFPRSAVKAFQALPLLESGAADHFGFDASALALACGSHSGEPGHIACAKAMLATMGLDENALECGPHWPVNEIAARALAEGGGQPRRIHNNCSGKHAGLLAVASVLGAPTKGYVEASHPAQRAAQDSVTAITGASHAAGDCATDGCSMPTCAVPLSSLACGYARFGTGHGLEPARATAAARLRQAVATAPWMVAGTGRFDTEMMTALGERVFMKTGAEGVYAACLPDRGLGVAVKADDGAGRASEAMIGALISALIAPEDPARPVVERLAAPPVKSWAGEIVGGVRAQLPLRL